MRVEASRDDAERLALVLPGSEKPVAPTHWNFGQLASLVGALAAYRRQLPAPLGRDQFAIWADRIENAFGRLKDWHRIAMRYDRCAHTFFSAICIATVVTFWL